MNREFDLLVVGGGPAGTSAAITAARAGWRVLMLERGRVPRHKVCGEFVSAESLSLLQWLLGEAGHEVIQRSLPLAESRLLLDGRTVRIPVDPPAASITRHELDLALWEEAKKSGATVLQETTVRGIQESSPFCLRTSAGEFRGRALINASGRWSNLRQKQPTGADARWLGLKAHCLGETESSVDLYFFKGGYCGVQPVRASDGSTFVNVCALVRPGIAVTLEQLFQSHSLLHARSRRWRTAFTPLSTFPAIFRKPCPVLGKIANAGDAAAFVDPFVGDGISLALRGGHLAAFSLSAFFRGDCALEEALTEYAGNYRRALRPVYRVSSVLRKLLAVPRPLRAPFLAACEMSPKIARYMVAATRSRAFETAWIPMAQT